MPAPNLQSAKPSKKKYIAILLALLLGNFGGHLFYLGKYKRGALHLIFFWTFIPFFLSLYDLIVLAFMPHQKFISYYSNNHSLNNSNTGVNAQEGTLDDVLAELNSLIGLESVKEEITTLINFIKIQNERKSSGLKVAPLSYHLVFTGNPGTGKTTVARIISKIYHHIGILNRGHLIETDRSGLIAEYVGHTAIKVNKVVNSALDGILFVDEAYSLSLYEGDSFGNEAIATLIKQIEDNRDRLVLIMAGYTQEMKEFINVNPGFESRINRYIEFPDYTPNELLAIFESFCTKSDYKLDDEAKIKVIEVFTKAYNERDKSFGNGRLARNVFENSIENQSNRIAQEKDIDTLMLTVLKKEDIIELSK